MNRTSLLLPVRVQHSSFRISAGGAIASERMKHLTPLLILILLGLLGGTIALATLQEQWAEEEVAAEIQPPYVAPTPAADGEGDHPTSAPATPVEKAKESFKGLFDGTQWAIWGQRALLVAIVLVVALIVMRIGRRILMNIQESRRLPDSVMLPIRRLLRGLVLLAGLLLALQFMGLSMAHIWTTLAGVLALIGVGFIAVWSVLSNIACSFMLMMFKPFRIGDHVELVENAAGPNTGGRVSDVTLMYVVLREETEEGPAFIQIPNNLFFQKVIRRRAGKRTVNIEDHVEKHGFTGREQAPPKG